MLLVHMLSPVTQAPPDERDLNTLHMCPQTLNISKVIIKKRAWERLRISLVERIYLCSITFTIRPFVF